MPDHPLEPTDEALARVEALLRELDDDDRGRTPPAPEVWDGIERRTGPTDRAASAAPDAGNGEPRDELARRRARRNATWVGVAAAVALVVVGASVVMLGGDDGGTSVAAVADLVHLEGFDPVGDGATASAELVEGDEGYEIVLTDATLPAPDGEAADLEIWLISPDADGQVADLVSLGLVGTADHFAVPTGYDPDEFSVVDISVEPRDGDASHSGRSILRGPFVAV